MNAKQRVFHTATAQHHLAMGSHHEKAADFHGQLSAHLQSTDAVASAAHSGLQSCHRSAAAEHESESARHLEHCKTADDQIEKGADSSDVQKLCDRLDKLLAGVAPMPNGLSVVPRYGAPRPGGESDPVKKVDPSLRHVISDPTERQ
jgi:hypothetical protein